MDEDLQDQMSPKQKLIKRLFDLTLAVVGLALSWPIILLAWLVASIETRSNGLFVQERIGEGGKHFLIYKIRTMYPDQKGSTITTAKDARITKSGKIFRRYKIDELPQLFNILKGDMSFVGPRPDVPGYADRLEGEDRIILSIKPGITGPASIKYKNEEEILAKVENPKEYNDKVIWPDKVRINKKYIKNWSLKKDISYILKTFKG